MSDGDGQLEARPDMLLVSMPFGMLESPSLALGILQARLRAAGFSARTRHFTVDYAARIGPQTYGRIAGGFPKTTDLLGEWIFSHAVHAKSAARVDGYLDRVFAGERPVPSDPDSAHPAEIVRALAADAGAFADEVAAAIAAERPRVVGFTSVFQQNNANIAVAMRLRALDPGILIVLGGANCEDAMGRELARQFSCFDHVVSGEADLLIVPIVAALVEGREPIDDPQVAALIDATRSDRRFLQAKMVQGLADHELPDFGEFVEAFERTIAPAERPALHIPMETSRGCWWGAKQHCTFCGLNGGTMTFRSRPAAQVIEDLRLMHSRYPSAKISFVDNIMDHAYFDEVLAKLPPYDLDLDMFYEIKSNVTKDQMRIAHAAGLRHIQPGIESLSDPVLKLMRKGVRAIQNLQLLKWCGELGIKVDWNILWGFAGEQPEDYAATARLVPLICHLPPPARGSAIRLDRFSPNFAAAVRDRPQAIAPYAAYYDVYDGLETAAVANMAYFFDDGPSHANDRFGYVNPLTAAIDAWRASYGAGNLVHVNHRDDIVILDSRPLRPAPAQFTLTGDAAAVYAACDTAQSLPGLARLLPELGAESLRAALDDLLEKQIVWSDGTQYLALSLCLTSFLEARAGARGVVAAVTQASDEADRSATEVPAFSTS